MSPFESFLTLDFPMLAAGVLASVACALVGALLVLRRMSLMGDAISHAVLPGIVAGFLFAGTVQAMPIFIGAALVGVLTALLSQLVHRWGRLEPGAAMGIVFTVLFATGVLMLETTHSRATHIDADCVLHGAMEHALWIGPPTTLAAAFTSEAWAGFPRQVTVLLLACAANVAFITLLFKELRIATFDPGLARSQGVNPELMHYLLMTFVAITVIAAFEAVGSILVVAMLIVPGLVAHLYTNRLGSMLVLAALVGAIAAAGGWGAAAALDLNAAAMIGVALGVVLALAVLIAPNGGWAARLRSPRAHEKSPDTPVPGL
jgi:manganese/zinc/iron transport system permease protein